jgi:hypothetical protein
MPASFPTDNSNLLTAHPAQRSTVRKSVDENGATDKLAISFCSRPPSSENFQMHLRSGACSVPALPPWCGSETLGNSLPADLAEKIRCYVKHSLKRFRLHDVNRQ